MHRNTARKLGQIPEGALIVGVDPHKHKHAVVVMTREAEVVAKFKVSVGRDGYAGSSVVLSRRDSLRMTRSVALFS